MPETEEKKQITYMPDRESPARSNGRIFDFGEKGRVELSPGVNYFSEDGLTLLASDSDFQTIVQQGAIQLPEGYSLPDLETAKQQVEQKEKPTVETASSEVPLPAPINTPLVVNIESGETPTVDPEIRATEELQQAEQQRVSAAQQGQATSAQTLAEEEEELEDE